MKQPPRQLPPSLADALEEARHNPAAYAKLRDYNPREVKRDPFLDRFCEATHAYASPEQRARKPSRMFELGPERVRALVSPKAQPWLDALEKWKGGSLVVCGPTGLGKTAALVWWCLNQKRQRWQWVDGVALGQANRRTPLGETPELIHLAASVPVLIVDDPDHARDRDPFVEVLRARYAEGLPLFIATGKSLAELDEHYGDALVRRMVQGDSEGLVVELW